jgi:hypothetical protein
MQGLVGLNPIAALLNHGLIQAYDMLQVDAHLRANAAPNLVQLSSTHAADDHRRLLLRSFDRQQGKELSAQGIIPPDLDMDFREAIARVLRVNREGLASWEDEVATFTSTYDASARLQMDEVAYHEGIKKIVTRAKKFFFVINFDFNPHDLVGHELISLFSHKMRQGLEGALIFDEVGGRHTFTYGAQKQWMEDLRSLGMQVINNFSLRGVEHRANTRARQS